MGRLAGNRGLLRAALLAGFASLASAQSIDFANIPAGEAGLDAAKLESWRSDLAAHGTTGLILIRRGRIALEWYAPGWDANRPHGTASMAKALVGGMSLAVAMSDGRISPDDLASKYIAGWRADPLKSKITIRQLATHTSGIEDAEQDDLPHDRLQGWKGDFWRRMPDPFSIAVRQAPVLFEPGTQNAYSNPGMAALSYAITASLQGGEIRTLLKERVYDPLGLLEQQWSIGYGRAYEVDGLKLYANWGGATFTARAAARVGQLMMLGGKWGGRELIGREVVRKALTDQGMPRPARSATDPAPGSGLAWYTNTDSVWPAAPRDAFAGAGAQHQFIMAIPSLDLVVVRNGDALGDTKTGFWGPVYSLVIKPLMEAVTMRSPYPPSYVIRGAVFGKEIRRAAIDSDNWPITWGDDDAQYTSYGDGFGFEPFVEKKLGMGFARITGGADDYRGTNLRSDGERTGNGAASAKASGILMVDGVLYLWVRNVANSQLLWSLDHGKTWTWGFRMESGFGSPAFLNFGRNYAGARDGYVYTYSQDGPSAYESDNGLVLARAPKERIRERGSWQFFERLGAEGPVWTKDAAHAGPVFSYPSNCQRVDVVYDPGIRRYLMALGYDHAGGWGLFDAPEPWGPWTTTLHRRWDVTYTHGYRLPAKWISPDGLRLTLVFSGIKPNDAFCTRTLTLTR
ncbi:MAG TPA: serine hydrolase [Bryobacteraceae bacterium]|nr:serine hydrolase [Bryobacteraceae bacterium]